MLIDAFYRGASASGQVLAYLSGLLLSGLVFAAAALLLVILAGMEFDWATSWLARRWQAKGACPKSRICRIILAHAKRDGEV